ncbi:alpha/beta hydrolase [Phaeobacter sp.]|uniref:alpha/beta fold hydrolase n=1 Tax=Phaeobacter sp. TaxID=1902409 RepID=UPI0025F764D1|nr:alpha/beta hydrolase [Phaeobacter sp.]
MTDKAASPPIVEPLVMIPGLIGDAVLFEPQLRALSGVLPVMVAPPAGGDRIEVIARHLLDQLPARFALLGHGLGGVVAMELCRRAPERITRLCLMSTTPLPDTPDQAAAREPLIIRARTGRLEDVLATALPPEALAPSPQRMEILGQLHTQALMLGEAFFVARARAMQRRTDQQGSLRRFRGATLVICGDADPITPVKRHEFMATLMPNARLHVVQGAGHVPTLEKPQEVITVLAEWLAQDTVDPAESPRESEAPQEVQQPNQAAVAEGPAETADTTEPTEPTETAEKGKPLPPLTLTNPL